MKRLNIICSLGSFRFGPSSEVRRIVSHETIKRVTKRLMQLIKIAIVIYNPNHCAISSSFHMLEETLAVLMATPEEPDKEIDAASFLTGASLNHPRHPLLLGLRHMRGHEHIALERAAEKAAAEPQCVSAHRLRS